MGSQYVQACSRDRILKYTRSLRDQMGLEQIPCFPIIDFIEKILPRVFPEFYLVVSPVEIMGDLHGLSNHSQMTITLREDVYYGACAGKGRDRFTCAHELGHFLMHPEPSYARSAEPIKRYCDPEWQADAFAGELLIPRHIAMEMHLAKIADVFQVSPAAAQVQYNIMHNLKGGVPYGHRN